jgi:APA family basic amino acid/polyamine antiporter
MISAAVLTALNITDTSLVLLWHQSPNEKPHLAENLLVMFHMACWVVSFLMMRYLHTRWGQMLCLVAALTMLVSMLGVYQWCPKCDNFGGQRRRKRGSTLECGSFRTPFVPFWPCIGIFLNWYLLAQLDLSGILGLLGFLASSTVYYFLHGIHHSIGNNGGWAAESEFPAERTSLVQLGRLSTRQPLQ